MRRTLLITALAAVCSAVAFAPSASAAKFSLSTVSATSAGSVGPGYCGVTVTATYAGRPPGNARAMAGIQFGITVTYTTFASPVPASGTPTTYQISATELGTGTSKTVFTIDQPNGRRLAYVNLSPTYTTTTGTCPPSGTSMGSYGVST